MTGEDVISPNLQGGGLNPDIENIPTLDEKHACPECGQNPCECEDDEEEREYSVTFKLPALGVAVFSCTPGKKPEKVAVAAKKPTTAKKTARKTAPKKENAKKVAAEKVAVKKTVAKKAGEKKTVSRKTVKKDIAV